MPGKSSATVSAGLVRAVLDYAVVEGVPHEALLGRSGLLGTVLDDQDTRVPLERYRALIGEAIALSGDATLPLRYSVSTRIEEISIVGLIVHASTSMSDSPVQLNRYARLMVEVDVMSGAERFEVEALGGEVWVVDRRPDPNDFPELTEIAFGRFIGEFRRHFPDTPFALEVEVSPRVPDTATLTRRSSACRCASVPRATPCASRPGGSRRRSRARTSRWTRSRVISA